MTPIRKTLVVKASPARAFEVFAHRMLLAWQLNAQFASDPALVTEVEARFFPEDGGRTRVEFEHRNLERFGEAAFVFLLVFLHVLRIYRPEDRPVRVAASVASVAWVGLALAFGAAVGNIADPRALMHAVVTAGLLVTSALGPRARPAGEAAMA